MQAYQIPFLQGQTCQEFAREESAKSPSNTQVPGKKGFCSGCRLPRDGTIQMTPRNMGLASHVSNNSCRLNVEGAPSSVLAPSSDARGPYVASCSM